MFQKLTYLSILGAVLSLDLVPPPNIWVSLLRCRIEIEVTSYTFMIYRFAKIRLT